MENPNNKFPFASPQDAENAFYEAIERGDVEALMAVWAEDEEILCVNPSGIPLVGHAAIRTSWQRIFENNARLSVRHVLTNSTQTPFAAVHCVQEDIGIQGEEVQRAPVLTTNVYLHSSHGWRLVAHHSSPANPNLPPSMPKVLH